MSYAHTSRYLYCGVAVYHFGCSKLTVIFSGAHYIVYLPYPVVFIWDIISCYKGRALLTPPIVFVVTLAQAFNSHVIKTSTNGLLVVCAHSTFMVWLSWLRYSTTALAAFVDFFGVSYANGCFANVAIFTSSTGGLYKFLVVGNGYVFTSGSAFFKGLEWYEREAHDLCGCFFENSIDRRALLLPYCYGMHPLQKTQYTLKNSKTKGSDFLSFITWCNI